MKTETPFLDFYNECIKSGSIKEKQLPHAATYGGLCSTSIGNTEQFKMIADYADDIGYWGHGYQHLNTTDENREFKFTPLRQTIVLFCAAINNEL